MSHLCNAALIDDGRCTRLAGFMTNHLGEGKCYEHGGLTPPAADVFRDAIESHGLGGIMDLAETLSHDEVEYIQHVSAAALVAIRAKVIAALMDEGRSPKEQSELALTLRRVEASIHALKDGAPMGLTDPEALARQEAEAKELARLEALRDRFGIG